MSRGQAVGKENVLIRSGSCAVTILPQLGGKIASLRVGDRELLQHPLAPRAPRTRTMSFDSGDASGWDECLPAVAPCVVETTAGIVSIPDHGDLWRVEWAEIESGAGPSDQSVTLRAECFSLPLTLERTLTLTSQSSGKLPAWRLQADYTLTNTGSSPTPWSWAAHPLFVAEAGDRILLPASIRSLRVEGSGGGRLGKNSDTVSWPVATLPNGGKSDLSVAQGPESGIGDKLFSAQLTAEQNWCALERPKAGVIIRVRFDPEAIPYLGLWICYGGWPDRPGVKQMCVALEPATAPVDSLAETGPWSRVLAAGKTFTWSMTVEIEST